MASWRLETVRSYWERVVHCPCRQCCTLVHVLTDVCPKCGTYAPVRVPCSSTIIVAAMSVAAIWIIRTSGL